jgi:hypothetical protein
MTAPLVQAAATAHRLVAGHETAAAAWRAKRDVAVRRVYARGEHTYSSLAAEVGCSPELIAKIVQARQRK